MPLIRIQSYPGSRQVFIASEAISHLAVVELSSVGSRYVKLGVFATSGRIAGVLYGEVTSALGSGKICRVVTEGIVSGVICAAAIEAGDRVTLASGGRIAAFNNITPLGAISGEVTGVTSGKIPAGVSGLISGLLASGVIASGAGMKGFSGFVTSGFATLDEIIISGALFGSFSGAFHGTPFNTGQVLGKALASGAGAGSGIPVLVTLGG